MIGYAAFSEFYDEFMENVEYNKRADYIFSLFEKFDRKPSLLLDVACGTGEFSKEFINKNIDVIGTDISPEMLNIAREKCPETLFLLQSAEELDLFGTVDGAVCLMDSLNHIVEFENFKKAIAKISLFLEPERLFIFDVNTPYKHKEILGDNAFVLENENVFCTWQNQTDENLLTEISLDFFCLKENGDYERTCDDFSERAYTIEQIEEALVEAGLEIIKIYDDLSFSEPKEDSQRVYYITKKVK